MQIEVVRSDEEDYEGEPENALGYIRQYTVVEIGKQHLCLRSPDGTDYKVSIKGRPSATVVRIDRGVHVPNRKFYKEGAYYRSPKIWFSDQYGQYNFFASMLEIFTTVGFENEDVLKTFIVGFWEDGAQTGLDVDKDKLN